MKSLFKVTSKHAPGNPDNKFSVCFDAVQQEGNQLISTSMQMQIPKAAAVFFEVGETYSLTFAKVEG